MFDIGGLELLIIAVVGLLVIGPERLPETLRTLGLWLGRLRRSFTAVKAEIEKEVGMDDVKRQLHNEAVMEEMKRIEAQVQNTVHDAKIDPGIVSGTPTTPYQAPDHRESPDVAAQSNETSPVDPEPVAIPPSEAELEAAHERKVQAAKKNAEVQDNA